MHAEAVRHPECDDEERAAVVRKPYGFRLDSQTVPDR